MRRKETSCPSSHTFSESCSAPSSFGAQQSPQPSPIAAAPNLTASVLARGPALLRSIISGLSALALAEEIAEWFGFDFSSDAIKSALEAFGIDADSSVMTMNPEQIDQIVAALQTLAPGADSRRILASIQSTAPETQFEALLAEIQAGAEVVNAVKNYRALASLLRVPVTQVDTFMGAIEGWLDMEPDDRAAAQEILRGGA